LHYAYENRPRKEIDIKEKRPIIETYSLSLSLHLSLTLATTPKCSTPLSNLHMKRDQEKRPVYNKKKT